ncbi:hypothetical protein FHR95_003141 [Halomonas fontilapidosi]|uniref:DUF995 domain-containing protein n=1 Tax=Halomonas fontilapidosi TaxID=616675 RepID=A0A7W5DMN1_9GAMM|nr:hypothetical protein [Halomonas fontilapidosi]MBB3185551.1 hypothetical protein [Halomonas fontilapidosi]
MKIKISLVGIPAVVILASTSFSAAAETEMEEALDKGARQLTSDEIAERFVGKTGTWVSASGDRKIAIHYSEDNVLTGKLLGGDWSGTGYYGVTNDDSICVSWDPTDEGRLRCLDVLVVDGVVTKFNAGDGSLNGSYQKFEDGNTL